MQPTPTDEIVRSLVAVVCKLRFLLEERYADWRNHLKLEVRIGESRRSVSPSSCRLLLNLEIESNGFCNRDLQAIIW